MVHVIVNNEILNSYFQTVAVISQVYAEQPTLGVWLMLVTSTNSNILYTMITAWTQNSVHIPDKDIKSWHKLHYFTHNVFGKKKKRNPHFENAPNNHLKKWLIEHLLNSLHRRIIKNQTRKKQSQLSGKGQMEKMDGKGWKFVQTAGTKISKLYFCRWNGSLGAEQNLLKGLFFVCL